MVPEVSTFEGEEGIQFDCNVATHVDMVLPSCKSMRQIIFATSDLKYP